MHFHILSAAADAAAAAAAVAAAAAAAAAVAAAAVAAAAVAAAAAGLCVAILRLLLQQLLLFVIVCRMAKIVAGSLNCFLSLYSQTYIIFNACTPWQCCRIYGLDLRILHPR